MFDEPSDAIAVAGIVISSVLSVILYAKTRSGLQSDDLRTTLLALQSELERTNLFGMNPEDEVWKYGFRTLLTLNGLLAGAFAATKASKGISRPLIAAIQDTLERVRELRKLEDSWKSFSHGKSAAPASLQRRWPDLQNAIAMLKALSVSISDTKARINEFLSPP